MKRQPFQAALTCFGFQALFVGVTPALMVFGGWAGVRCPYLSCCKDFARLLVITAATISGIFQSTGVFMFLIMRRRG